MKELTKPCNESKNQVNNVIPGVLDSWFMKFVVVKDFLSDIPKKDKLKWLLETGEQVNVTVEKYFVQLIGKPVVDFIK